MAADSRLNYGSWIRKNDPVLFDGLFDEWLNME